MRRGENASAEHVSFGGRRWLALGIAAAAAYLLTALIVAGDPGRVLFDGLVPLNPYRWVRPLPIIPWGGPPALAGGGSLPLAARGSGAGSIATGDGQAVAVFPQDAVAPREGESSIQVKIAPLHPRRLPPVPANVRIDGNAYLIEARYAASGQPVVLRRAVTVLLTYPLHAEHILGWSGTEWTRIPTTAFPTSQKVYGESSTLGIFVAAGPPRPAEGAIPWWPYLAAAALLAMIVAATLLRRRASARGRSAFPSRGT
ncbi:MAG: hypothetical protein ACRDIC_21120 [bacterium]